MNSISRFYPGDEATLFAVNIVAQVTAAGLLVWLARRFLRKSSAPTRHGVYLAALTWVLLSPLTAYVCQSAGIVTLAIPVAQAQVPTEPKPFIHVPVAEQPPASQPSQAEVPPAKSQVQPPDRFEPGAAKPDVAERVLPTSSKEAPTEKLPASVPATPTTTEPRPVVHQQPGASWEVFRIAVTLAFLLWGLGVLYFLARFIHGLMMLAALRRGVRPIHDERLDAVREQVCQALGVDELPLLVAPFKPGVRVGSPVAIGIWRPMVVLPTNLVDLLDDRQLREVLIHECAHVLRRDHVVGLLQRLVEMLFWPHPLVHLLNRELAQAREEVCDNHVLQASSGPDYARTLLALAECSTEYHCIPAASGLLGPRWRLEDRVAGLLNQGRKAMIRMNRVLALGVAVVFMATALAVAGTRLIGAIVPPAPDAGPKEVVPAAAVELVPDQPDKKGENPMPPASEAVVKDGLFITIAPAKTVFKGKEPLAFVVTLKNVSKEALMLYDVDWAYALEIRDPARDSPWLPTPLFEVQRAAAAPEHSKILQPGTSVEIKLSLDKYVYNYGGSQNMLPRPLPYLVPAKYSVRATRQFVMNPARFDWPHRHWLGKIATNSAEFTVVDEHPAGQAANDNDVPDTVNGLAITIAPVKRAFVTQEPLAFVVTLKNVSKEPFMLFDADWAMSYGLEITRVADGELWVANPGIEVVRAPTAASDSKVLQPGASLEIKLSLRKYVYVNGDPKQPTSRTRPFLYPDFYNVRVTRSFAMNPVKFDWPHKHWVGRLGTEQFAMNKTLKKVVEFMIIPSDKPAAATDLSMTLAPAKAVFAAKEPLAFNVKLQNVSKEPFMLYQADRAIDYVLEIKNSAGGAPIILNASKEALKRGESSGIQYLEPGTILQIKLPLDGYQYTYQRAKDAAPAAHDHLEPGKYTIQVTRKFTPNLSPTLIAYLNRFWVGTKTTKPVEFIVAAEKPAGGAVLDKAVPDTANGLSITVTPAKAVFPERDLKDLVTFTVKFKNVSNKTLLLYDVDETMGYKVEFNRLPAGGTWVPQYNLNHNKVREAPRASDSRALAPGATLEKQVVMNGVTYELRGVQLAKPTPTAYLVAGKYRVTVGFKGVMNPANADWKDEHWIGAIAATSPEFTMVSQKPAGAVRELSVFARTDHLVFPGNVIPHFKVRFENVSDNDFSLFGHQFPHFTMHIKNKATGIVQTWKPAPLAAAPALRPLVLKAGKAHEEEPALWPKPFIVPPKNIAAAPIEPGKYEIVFEIDLREAPNAREIIPACWVGHVRTAPVEFTIGDGNVRAP